MPDSVIPAAPDTPATPAATTPASTPPVVAAASLIPEAEGVATPPPAEPATPAAPLAANQNAPEWFLSEGVKGAGEPPAWYKADKYKTVDAQAKAYVDLEKRLGSFTGAPKDGKYEMKLPEGVAGEFDSTHPLFQNFNTWAGENQLSQDGYNAVLGMFAEYEASLTPDLASIKADLGADADTRIGSVASWAKANLSSEQYGKLREATSGVNAAVVIQAIESIIGKTRQVTMPKPGGDVPNTGLVTEASVNAMQAKMAPDGKRRLYEVDPQWRAHVEKTRTDFYTANQKAA